MSSSNCLSLFLSFSSLILMHAYLSLFLSTYLFQLEKCLPITIIRLWFTSTIIMKLIPLDPSAKRSRLSCLSTITSTIILLTLIRVEFTITKIRAIFHIASHFLNANLNNYVTFCIYIRIFALPFLFTLPVSCQ
jgi:hypothetical protein